MTQTNNRGEDNCEDFKGLIFTSTRKKLIYLLTILIKESLKWISR